jgi:hypothetical protein
MQDERGLNGLANECHETARSKGFWERSTGNNIGEKLMMVVSEIAEAHDEYRAGHAIGLIEYEHPAAALAADRRTRNPEDADRNPGKPVGFPIELADALIRILDLAAGLGIDIEEAIRIKMDFNTTRPHRHGGKLV